MKRMRISLYLLLLLLPAITNAQAKIIFREAKAGNGKNAAVYNDENKIKYDLRNSENVYFNVRDKKVAGNPYLFNELLVGDVVLMDGRRFQGNKLHYNTFDQQLFFFDGKDELEVNDPIKEFVLDGTPKGVLELRFVNANQFVKGKKPLYYEVLLETSAGYLLKLNKKITEQLDGGLQSTDSKYYFKPTQEFYYFNKATSKLSKLKLDETTLTTAIGIDKSILAGTGFENMDMNDDEKLVDLFMKIAAGMK
jgi:hypothetical protein